MKKISILLCYLIYALVLSCATKKKVVEKTETIKSDTLISKVEVIEKPAILTSLTINEICDTITGKAKNFKQVINVGKDTVIVEVEGNELRIKNNILHDIISKKDSLYKISQLEINHLKETTKTKTTINKWHFILFAVIVLFIFYPYIPKFINSFFRKFI